MSDPKTLKIAKAEALNGRSLRVDFDNGEIRLFDVFRLRGPKYIPLIEPEVFSQATVKDGDLYWESLDTKVAASYVYRFSVHYDPNYAPKEYIPTKRDKIGERVATILFPVMAVAGLIGTVIWYINN